MGYNIYIGEKIFNKENYKSNILEYMEDGYSKKESKKLALNFSVDVKNEYVGDAPAFGEISDFTNSRFPSYSTWGMIVDLTGLNELFYGENGAFKNHPGVFFITKEWLEELNKKLRLFKQRYKMCIPTYDDNAVNADKILYYDDSKIPVNHILCRVVWLEFWCNYAFEKYNKKAIILNS